MPHSKRKASSESGSSQSSDEEDDDSDEDEEDDDEDTDDEEMLAMRATLSQKMLDEKMVQYGGKARAAPSTLSDVINSTRFTMVLAVAIGANTISIGVEVDYGCDQGGMVHRQCAEPSDILLWYVLENLFTCVFLAEMILRLMADKLNYFTDPWNLLDFVLVLLACLDGWILPAVRGLASLGLFGGDPEDEPDLRVFSVLRVFRILRMLRLLKLVRFVGAFKELWLLVRGFGMAIKSVLWIVVVLTMWIFVFGILAVMIVGKAEDKDFPLYQGTNANNSTRYMMTPVTNHGVRPSGWIPPQVWTREDYYGSVPKSMFTLFQLVTRDHWNTRLVKPVVMEQKGMVLFFLFFLYVGRWSIWNMIIGSHCEMIISAQAENDELRLKREQEKDEKVLASLKQIFEAADTDGSGEIDRREFSGVLSKRHVQEKLTSIGIPVDDGAELFRLLDGDGSGSITIAELLEGCRRVRGLARAMDLYAIAKTVTSNISILQKMESALTVDNHVLDVVLERLDKLDFDHFRMGPKVRRRKMAREARAILRAPHVERTNPNMLAGLTICSSEGPAFSNFGLTISSFNAAFTPQATGDWLRATKRSAEDTEFSKISREDPSTVLSTMLGAPVAREMGTGFFSPTTTGGWIMPSVPVPTHPNYPAGAATFGAPGGGSPDISLEFSETFLDSTMSGGDFANGVPPSGRRSRYNVGPVAML